MKTNLLELSKSLHDDADALLKKNRIDKKTIQIWGGAN